MLASSSPQLPSAEERKLYNVRNVDLKLPLDKHPLKLDNRGGRGATIKEHRWSSKEVYAIGSSDENTMCYKRELGFFECVKEAWGNHWNLRTSPEDWWFPVACRVAKAIDKAAKSRNSAGQKVRETFVDHEGKQEIQVNLPVYDIYEIQYNGLFAEFSTEIRDRIKCPTFATCMQNDFSTTTPSQKIASEINLMASMQEFFSYHTGLCGCGIKAVEMQGTQADWDHLLDKLQQLRQELEPIMDSLGFYHRKKWFDHVEYVYRNLAKTYSNPEDPEVADFWADILMHSKDWKYGPSGFGGHEVDAYNGWLVQFLLGRENLWQENLRDETIREELKTLNSVPMTLTFEYRNPKVSDGAKLTAGIAGFEVIDPDKTFNSVPSLKPCHMWAMLLPPKSPLMERYHA